MTNEKMYSILTSLINEKQIDSSGIPFVLKAIEELKKDIQIEVIGKPSKNTNGFLKYVDHCNRIMKTTRPTLAGSWIKDGCTYATNGYSIVKVNKAIDYSKVEGMEKTESFFNVDDLCFSYVTREFLTNAKLAFTLAKAELKTTDLTLYGKKDNLLFEVSPNLFVNPGFLKLVLEAADIKEGDLMYYKENSSIERIVFVNESASGLLLPVRKKQM